MTLSPDEARLIAIHRAITKFDRAEIVALQDASLIASYVENTIDLETLEALASETEVEYFLDGLILGIAVFRLLSEGVPVDELPKPLKEKRKQFQTGIDPETGVVNVNKT